MNTIAWRCLVIATDIIALTVIYTVKIHNKKKTVLNATDKTAPCFSVFFSAVSVSEISRGSVKREKKDRSKKCVTKYTDT